MISSRILAGNTTSLLLDFSSSSGSAIFVRTTIVPAHLVAFSHSYLKHAGGGDLLDEDLDEAVVPRANLKIRAIIIITFAPFPPGCPNFQPVDQWATCRGEICRYPLGDAIAGVVDIWRIRAVQADQRLKMPIKCLMTQDPAGACNCWNCVVAFFVLRSDIFRLPLSWEEIVVNYLSQLRWDAKEVTGRLGRPAGGNDSSANCEGAISRGQFRSTHWLLWFHSLCNGALWDIHGE